MSEQSVTTRQNGAGPISRLDRAGHRSISRLRLPWLDVPLRRVARFADFSKPWLLVAGLLAVTGGPAGRRAGASGLAAIAATSLLVNQPLKALGARRRPDRVGLRVPVRRWVPMPGSTSFPSGHSASAAAFAVAVGGQLPVLRWPLRAAAGVVGFSRVYTGVHYPSDVLVGAAVGAGIGRLTSRAAQRLTTRVL